MLFEIFERPSAVIAPAPALHLALCPLAKSAQEYTEDH